MILPALATALALMLAGTGVQGSDPGDELGQGHITMGVFSAHSIVHAMGITDPAASIYSFLLPVEDHRESIVETLVEEPTGAGYFVDMAFYADAQGPGSPIPADCTSTEDSHGILQKPFGPHEIRTRCMIPADAETVVVYAHTGVSLDVTLVVVPEL